MSDNAPAAAKTAKAKQQKFQASALKQCSFQWVRRTISIKWHPVLNAIEDYMEGQRGGKHFVGGWIRA